MPSLTGIKKCESQVYAHAYAYAYAYAYALSFPFTLE